MTLFGNDHVRRYQETDGAEGYHWRNDTTILLLTTKGRKSGEDRTSALIYRDYEDKQLIVASKGGADQPPAWYLNLESDPDVHVQIKGDKFAARARVAHRRREARDVGAHGAGLARLRELPGQDRPRHPRRRPRAHDRAHFWYRNARNQREIWRFEHQKAHAGLIRWCWRR